MMTADALMWAGEALGAANLEIVAALTLELRPVSVGASPLSRRLIAAENPSAFVCRLVTRTPTPYILLGHTPAEVQAQLPSASDARRNADNPSRQTQKWLKCGFQSSGLDDSCHSDEN